ncbi:DUF4942 domain-containing protein [Photorhabdus tasmaniensis]
MCINGNSELKIRTRTEQLANDRDSAVQKFQEGMRLIAEASAICGISLFNSKIMATNAFGLPSSLEGSIEAGHQEIDRKVWNTLFSETGMDRFWNHKQREAFTESLRTDPPIASLAVIRSTLRHAMSSRGETLAEGFVNLLTRLDRSYKSNTQQYTMPKKLVLRGIFPSVDVMRYNGFSQDNHFYLNDFENIVCICSSEPTPVAGGGLTMTDRLTALRSTDFTGSIRDNNGWECRLFANGNVHITIECNSLLNALNDLISIHFASQLPARGKQ